MNKFVLMIFSATIFFIGVGGVVDQIGEKFASVKPRVVMVQRSEIKNGELEKFDSLESFALIKKAEQPGEDFQIKMRSPFPPEKAIEFNRQPAIEPLREEAEFPRMSDEDTIIFLDKESQNRLR